MRHKIGYNRLGRTSSHRKAMISNMMTSLFKYERIKTTKAKALEVRRYAEKTITRAKQDTVHNRRITARRIHDKAVLAKLYTDISPRFAERAGGYTRIIKLGQRYGDAADMVYLELVDRAEESADSDKKGRKKKSAGKEKKAEAETVETVETEEKEEKETE